MQHLKKVIKRIASGDPPPPPPNRKRKWRTREWQSAWLRTVEAVPRLRLCPPPHHLPPRTAPLSQFPSRTSIYYSSARTSAPSTHHGCTDHCLSAGCALAVRPHLRRWACLKRLWCLRARARVFGREGGVRSILGGMMCLQSLQGRQKENKMIEEPNREDVGWHLYSTVKVHEQSVEIQLFLREKVGIDERISCCWSGYAFKTIAVSLHIEYLTHGDDSFHLGAPVWYLRWGCRESHLSAFCSVCAQVAGQERSTFPNRALTDSERNLASYKQKWGKEHLFF